MKNIPRRNRLDLFSTGERAIWDAVHAVEDMGADPLLTEAVVLLGQAREKVADYVDGKPEKAAAFDSYLAEQMKDPEFRAAYEKAQNTAAARIDALEEALREVVGIYELSCDYNEAAIQKARALLDASNTAFSPLTADSDGKE